ncbi:MAG: hypothetical protein J1E35_03950 [Lachnospiraceae bacterium]|nr:hypothetical protein [Lachnospiraceae bacterium]
MVNLKKSIIAALVIAFIAVNGSAESAKAEVGGAFESNRIVMTVYDKDGKNVVSENQFHGNEGTSIQEGQVRANEAPTRGYDLSNRAYHYQFSGVDNYTFTRYYFKPDTDGHLIISVDDWNSGGAEVKIELYVKGTFLFSDTLVSTWTGDPATILGIGYTSLNPDKNYYFKFLPYMAESISGEGDIKY